MQAFVLTDKTAEANEQSAPQADPQLRVFSTLDAALEACGWGQVEEVKARIAQIAPGKSYYLSSQPGTAAMYEQVVFITPVEVEN